MKRTTNILPKIVLKFSFLLLRNCTGTPKIFGVKLSVKKLSLKKVKPLHDYPAPFRTTFSSRFELDPKVQNSAFWSISNKAFVATQLLKISSDFLSFLAKLSTFSA